MLHGIIDEDLACKLLESYFREPGRSLFECASPYVLTHVLRKDSLLRSDSPRRTTCALLVTILWVTSQTADDDSFFLAPGRKAIVCERLRKLMLSLIQERDQDSWDRDAGKGLYFHHQVVRCHPRFAGARLNNELDADTALVESVLAKCERSITDLARLYGVDELLDNAPTPSSDDQIISQDGPAGAPALASLSRHSVSSMPSDMMRGQSCKTADRAQARLVTVYSKFILHVLHVLLHGKWDPVSMLENDDGWVSSPGFVKCASHSIAASEAVSQILACDPELAFMPYLFGIYLLHGSFILLLFADRMPQIGLNESVERACEIIIRAHEVCVVTLSTQFQIRFRKVLRSTLYSVRSAGKPPTAEESASRLRALSVYRWSGGFTGLAA
ncbi:hypothetical protein KJ359_009704 [Pestalotiopsis sp. 9143b]|nr:hypothetical protein KJ359_009704 [Pestalotiopsis sp. 9143b]